MRVGVVAVEEPAQQAPALGLRDDRPELAAGAELVQQRGEQRADRAGHAGMKARVLLQQGREQGGARTRQARDEVKRLRRQVVVPVINAWLGVHRAPG